MSETPNAARKRQMDLTYRCCVDSGRTARLNKRSARHIGAGANVIVMERKVGLRESTDPGAQVPSDTLSARHFHLPPRVRRPATAEWENRKERTLQPVVSIVPHRSARLHHPNALALSATTATGRSCRGCSGRYGRTGSHCERRLQRLWCCERHSRVGRCRRCARVACARRGTARAVMIRHEYDTTLSTKPRGTKPHTKHLSVSPQDKTWMR